MLAVVAMAGDARGQGFGISMTGTTVDAGTVKPGQPSLLPYATQLTINAPAPWSLAADAPPQFTTSVAPVKTMPIDRLGWRIHAFATAFTSFVAGPQTLLAGQPPTPAAGRTFVMDLLLAPQFSEPPSDPSGADPYRATVTYSVTAGTIDSAYAWPNPFSPDGDGVNDRTALHWYQGAPRVVDVRIYTADGATLVRTLTEAAALGAGEQQIEWDGRDDARSLAPEGDYLYRIVVNPGEAIDPGKTLASGLVGLERGVGMGAATVTGVVSSNQTGGPLAGARVELLRAGGNSAGVLMTDAAGLYAFTAVAAGTYTLAVSAPLHFDQVTGNFEVTAGSTVTMNVLLVHNRSLTITKTVDTTDAEPGDVLAYLVDVSTLGGVETVENVFVHDLLPAGLRLVPGSARLDGQPAPPASLRGHTVDFPVGTLPPGTKVTLRYEAVVVADARTGALTNSASATGIVLGAPVRAGPTQARVFVHAGDTGDRSLVFGRVFLDTDGDGAFGPGDEPLPGSRVVADDGTVAIVDALGRYSMKGMRDGARALMAVANPDPQAVAAALVPSGSSRVRLVDLRFGVAAHVDFAFGQAELDAPPTESRARTLLTVTDATVGLDLERKAGGGILTVLRLSGRTATFLERDLGGGYRLTASLDSRRDPRDELGIGRDALSFQPEVADNSVTTPGPPDRLTARLRAPWGSVILGRTGVNFGKSELINSIRSFVGLDVEGGGKRWHLRGFAGGADTMVRLDEIPNDGTTGPFTLSAAPLLPSSDRAVAETRNAAGDAVARTNLARDVDYVIDYATGQLFLTAPWPLLSPTGERTVFLVEYEWAPGQELPRTLIAGGRADARIGTVAVGATVLHEDGEPGARTALGVDTRYRSERLDVAAEAAVSSAGPHLAGELPGDDPTALRVRTTFHPHPTVDVFGYLNRIGGAYTQRIDFRNPAPSSQSFGFLPPPSQSLLAPPLVRALFDGQRDFPFVLQGAQDRFEWGLGTLYRPRPDLDLSIGSYDVSNDLDDRPEVGRVTRHTDYVVGRWHRGDWPEVFLATTGTSTGGASASERAFLAATRWDAGVATLDAEYRLLFIRGAAAADGGDVTGNAALVRARYRRWRRFEPALMLEAGANVKDDCAAPEPCTVAETRLAALGFESGLGDVTVFAYGSAGEARDVTASPEPTSFLGAFAGTNVSLRRLAGTFRVDVSRNSVLGRQAAAGGRLRLVISEAVMAFTSVAYRLGNGVDPRAQWNNLVGLAYRPLVKSRLYAFLKYKDRSLPSLRDDAGPRRRSQLVALDLVVPVSRRLSVGTRGAWKRVRSSAGPVELALGAEELTWHVLSRYDVVVGGRVTRSTAGGETILGATLGAGIWFDRTLRLLLGVNYARHDWAFEADDSIPGVFLSLTGVYGAAGAPASFGH